MDLLGNKKRKEQKNFDNEVNLAIGSTLEKFASANAEFLNEYSQLSSMKRNWKSNVETQKGFAAEVKTVSRTNAENILKESNKRIARTDDVGSVNHPEFDSVEVDRNGNAKLDDNGNFVGGAQQKVHNDISKYDKYHKRPDLYNKYKNGKLDVPSDQIDKIKERWNSQLKKLEREESHLRKIGKTKLADQKKEEATRIKNTKNRLRDSKVSVKESIEARRDPLKSSAKEIAKVSHKAGIQAAKTGGAISGALSAGKNAMALIKGDKDANEAIVDVTKDTAIGITKSYASGAASSVIGGLLKKSKSQIVNNLAKKSGPTVILQTGLTLAKQINKLLSGQITIEEFIENIGKEGASLASSLTGANLGATVGTFVAPGVGTIVGGVIGGIVASIMSGALYHELKRTMQETKLSDEKRKIMKELCERLVKQEKEHREQVIQVFNEFLDGKEYEIRTGFKTMSLAIQNGESINSGLLILSNTFGLSIKFDDSEDLKTFLASRKTLNI